MRSLPVAVALAMILTACSGDSAPPAPEPGPTQTVCLEEVCVDYPADWDIEIGDDFVLLTHPLGSEASVGRMDMRGVVEGAGGTWPAQPEETMRRFWELLDELGEASLDDLSVGPGGVVDSEGSLDGRMLWHRLVPIVPPRAWGAELRAIDSTWETHAAIITGSLRAVGGG